MPDLRPRIFVSGMGAVTAVGFGVDALWAAARTGQSGIREAKLNRSGPNRVKLAAQVPEFEPQHYIESGRLPYCDRFTQLALIAADEALTQAGLPRTEKLGQRTAVILGTGIGGITTIEDLLHLQYTKNERAPLMAVPRIMGNAAASQISMIYGCTGPSFAVTSACSSASQAIGLGTFLIRSGLIDRAIVGGSESTITAMNIRVWELLRVLTPDACRPFSMKRNGMVLGEGAAVLVLESEKLASARHAIPLAEVAGYGTSSDAFDILRPDVVGATTAMESAMADSGLSPDQIDYVNAHGTGTVANDAAEAQALQRIFGDRLPGLPVSSTKPIHGHTLGAAGAIELIITIMALRDGVAPPTINWLGPDPGANLNPVPNEAREVPIRAAMSNSFAFGGINSCLIVVPSE